MIRDRSAIAREVSKPLRERSERILEVGGGSAGQGADPAAARKFARITAAEGSSPPFLYSAVEIEEDANDGHGCGWSDIEGGDDLTANLRSIKESTTSGGGKVPVGTIVQYWDDGQGGYRFDDLWYTGCYVG